MAKKSANGHNLGIELVGLNCAACGSNALGNFTDGVANCKSCGTTNVLTGLGKKLPKNIPTSDDVVVKIPQSIAIGELLRANQIPAATHQISWESDGEGGEVYESDYYRDPEDAEPYKDFLEDE